MLHALARRADASLGDGIEALVRSHHRRRLRRCGALHALGGSATGWATHGAPPRAGNEVVVHIDGAAAIPHITEAIRSARSHVHIAGWHVDPHFTMARDPGTVTLRALLAETAERVDTRVIAWAGPPIPLFHPWRSEVRRNRAELMRGTSVRVVLDSHNRPMHCHHEKLVIVDGRVAFVGGIDLTRLEGDRFDDSPHPSGVGLGWHDVAVRLRGPAVADVAAHFDMRWAALTGERHASGAPDDADGAPGGTRVQIVRTIPEGTYPAVHGGDFGILEVYTGALARARRLIYIENQFLWSPEVAAVLRAKLLDPPTDAFRLCVLLPSRPASGADDTRGQLATLADADVKRRLLVSTIGPTAVGRNPVYVHAKVCIVDDEWMTIGSANLNEHSLFNDTEVNIVTDDSALIRTTREALWSEHLATSCAGEDPLSILEERWRPLLVTRAPDGVPLRALGVGSRRTERLLGPFSSLLVDG